MNARRQLCAAALALAALSVAGVARAGGPLEIYNPVTRTPYRWPSGTTPLYVDEDGLGVNEDASVFLDHATATGRVGFALQQWNNVPTASFHGEIAGDFASIGLPQIDASNIFDVLGAWNGGGIHVVFDQDGSIHDALFGPYSGVLGFTVVEWVKNDGPWIQEATVVLNGAQVPTWEAPEDAASQYTGVITHELGHALGLAHSQTNGQLYFYFEGYSGPAGCPTPWPWTLGDALPASAVETMFPYEDLFGSGPDQATVDRLDDRNAFSDLYPGPGWSGSPSIRGTVKRLVKGAFEAQITGVNVIARNVADPFGDAVSAITGDHSQGLAGLDGKYAFAGLTPGASYVVYVDGIIAGAFSTPVQAALPGPEEYWNGASESGDGIKDDRCAYTTLSPVLGQPAVADITFNHVEGGPRFIAIDMPNAWISGLSSDGSVGVGAWDGGHLRWTPKGGAVDIGGYYGSPQPAISDDGRTIAGTVLQDGNAVAAIWKRGKSWTPLGGYSGMPACDGLLSSAWGVSNNGTVVGLGWHGCDSVSGFRFTPSKGMRSLGTIGDSALPGSRADAVSADGKLVVGWDQDSFGDWRGVRWDRGVESFFSLDVPATCDGDPGSPFHSWSFVGTAQGLNGAGSAVVGEGYPIERSYHDPDTDTTYQYCDGGGWLWTKAHGLRSLGEAPYPDFSVSAADVSDDASVATGMLLPHFWDFNSPHAMLWTPETGALDLQEFLAAQGTYAPGWLLVSTPALSGDGKTMGGVGYSPTGQQGYVVQMSKVLVCHAKAGNPALRSTRAIAFPEALADHLAHGDTIGVCGNGM